MEKKITGYTTVDISQWHRKEHFEAFQSVAQCTYNQTVQLDKRFHRSGVNTTTISGSFYTYIRKMWRVTVKTWPISLKGLLRICFSSQPIPG
ncbi:CatA-like O-acetyltransferase [Enterobacter mori]|uniref:CatA-like O-acetyltransferase n=1 Tax=Enterobacter mori TaxID=539813 RepID=UPI003BFA712C